MFILLTLLCIAAAHAAQQRALSATLNINDFLTAEEGTEQACAACVEAFRLGKQHASAEIATNPVQSITKDDLAGPFNLWRAIGMKRREARHLGDVATLQTYGQKFETFLAGIRDEDDIVGEASSFGYDITVKKGGGKINIERQPDTPDTPEQIVNQELLWYYAGLIGVFLKEAGVDDQYDLTALEVGIRPQPGVGHGEQGYQKGMIGETAMRMPQTWHIDTAFVQDGTTKHETCAPLYFVASNHMETHFAHGNLMSAFEKSPTYQKMWAELKDRIESTDEGQDGFGCPFSLTSVEKGCDVYRFSKAVLNTLQKCHIVGTPTTASDYGPTRRENRPEVEGSCFLAHFLKNGAVCEKTGDYCSQTFKTFNKEHPAGQALSDEDIKARFTTEEHTDQIHTYASAPKGTRKLTFMGPYQLHVPINNFSGETLNRWFLRFSIPMDRETTGSPRKVSWQKLMSNENEAKKDTSKCVPWCKPWEKGATKKGCAPFGGSNTHHKKYCHKVCAKANDFDPALCTGLRTIIGTPCGALQAALNPEDSEDGYRVDEHQMGAIQEFVRTGDEVKLEKTLPPSACKDRDDETCCTISGCGLSVEDGCVAEVDLDGSNGCAAPEEQGAGGGGGGSSSPLLRSGSTILDFVEMKTDTLFGEAVVTNEDIVEVLSATQHDL